MLRTHLSLSSIVLMVIAGCAADTIAPAQSNGSAAGAAALAEPLILGSGGVCVLTARGPSGSETSFEAFNLRSAIDASTRVGAAPRDSRTVILRGSCASQSDVCQDIAAPVCAVVGSKEAATFANRCALRVAVLNAAGDFGSASGTVRNEGACEVESCRSSEECASGEYCTVDDGMCELPPSCDVNAATSGERCSVTGDGQNDTCPAPSRCLPEACTESIPANCTGTCSEVPCECLGRCKPGAPRACAASSQCSPGEFCTVETGDCNPGPGCSIPGRVCPALCFGVCTPLAAE